jgi:hypothetical protein
LVTCDKMVAIPIFSLISTVLPKYHRCNASEIAFKYSVTPVTNGKTDNRSVTKDRENLRCGKINISQTVKKYLIE